MAQVQNEYTGDGSTVLFSFTFPYIETSDIKVSLDGVATTEYTLANATTVEFNVAPTSGAAILIRRQTEAGEMKATFFPGSAIRAQDLNDNFEQGLFVSQETAQDSTDSAESAAAAATSAAAAQAAADQASIDSAAAVTTATQASNDVSSALTQSSTAVSDSAAAVSTANAAQTASDGAVTTANDAKTTAEGIEGKADNAIATANSATITANNAEGKAQTALDTSITANDAASQALTVANNIDGKADFAIATAENAETIAQDALDAVSGDSPWIGDATSVYLADDSKSVGIGTSTPISNLDINGGAINTNGSLDTNNQVRIGVGNAPTYAAYLSYGQPDAGGQYALSIQSNSDTTSPIFLNPKGGYVGIGTDSAPAPLSISRDGSNIELDPQYATGLGRILFYDRVNNAYTQGMLKGSQFRFDIGTSEAMRIDANGKVGIGTSNPTSTLTVDGSVNSSDIRFPAVNSGGQANGFLTYDLNSTDNGGAGTGSLIIRRGNGAEQMRIDPSGKVGIGASNPAAKLEIYDSSPTLRLSDSATIGVSGRKAGSVEFYQNDASGGAGVGSSITAYHVNQSGDLDLRFQTGNGTERVRIDSNGTVGIGTSNPVQKLSVHGAANDTIDETTGTLKLQTSGGNGLLFGTQASSPYSSYVQSAFLGDTSTARYPLVLNPLGGGVGIGGTPGEALDVYGNVRVRGNLIVDGTGGGGGGSADTGYTNVKTDFGAVGNGTTDDTTAINNALQTGGAVYFPAGTYRITSTITLNNKAVHMYGDGPASRIMFDPATSGLNCLELKYSDGTPNPSQAYAISNLVIHAKQNKACGDGVLLHFTGAATLVGVCNKLTFTNVDIGSEFSSDANAGYFKKALHLLNSAGVVGTNLNIYTNSKTKVEYGVTDSVGIDIENSMAGHAMIRTLYLNNFYIQRYHTGIRAYSSAGNSYNSLESLYLSQGELLAAKALRMERMAAITVVGIHSDCRDYFFDSSNSYGDVHYASTVRIVGNDLRANRVDGEDVTTQDYFIKIKGQQTLITGNNIMSFKNTQGIIQTGGNPANQINTVITGNHFSGNGSSTFHSLRCESGSRQVTYGGNTLESFGGNLSPISNSVGSELSVYGQRAGNTV